MFLYSMHIYICIFKKVWPNAKTCTLYFLSYIVVFYQALAYVQCLIMYRLCRTCKYCLQKQVWRIIGVHAPIGTHLELYSFLWLMICIHGIARGRTLRSGSETLRHWILCDFSLVVQDFYQNTQNNINI